MLIYLNKQKNIFSASKYKNNSNYVITINNAYEIKP